MQQEKDYLKNAGTFKILFGNSAMLLGQCYESAYLLNKTTNEEFDIFEFYGDPTCGLIGPNNDWCLAGGNVLIFKNLLDNTLTVIDGLNDIYGLKAVDDYKVLILTDPWTAESAVWQLDIELSQSLKPTNLSKLQDVKTYISEPYSETVIW